MAKRRGCGMRVAGGAYLTTPLGNGPNSHPVECFLIDPPRAEADVFHAIGLAPRGLTLIQQGDVTHVLDWIGSDHYPNVADFIEETRAQGISRRIPRTADFARLTPRSRLFTVHSRARILNPEEYLRALLNSDEAAALHPCPAYTAWEHCQRGQADPCALLGPEPPLPCGRLWWHDVEGADGPIGEQSREIGDTIYTPDRRALGVEGRYELAIFGGFPIARIEVVADQEGGTHERALDAASAAQLPVALVDD